MWSKFCVALVTRYDLLSQKKFETTELFIFILDIFALTHHHVVDIRCDNIKDWSFPWFVTVHQTELMLTYNNE